MRSRQVAEALGEDARASQKAFLLNFPFVQQNKEDFLRPDELDRKTQFELSGFLDKMASALSQAVSALAIPAEAGKLTQGVSEFLSAYNRATAYVRLYGRTGKLSSRETQGIQEKFDSVKPSLEQILNAHAAGNPIPEFRAVLNAYDNILNNDLRPVDFSPPLNIPPPAQPAGAPAGQPFIPIVGPQAPRPQGVVAPVQAPPAQPAPAPPPPPQEPPADVPEAMMRAWIAGDANARNLRERQMRLWIRNNRPDISPDGQGAAADRYLTAELQRINAGRPSAREQYDAQMAAYNQARGQQVAQPPAQPPAPPVAPQQPEPVVERRRAATERRNNKIISTLEGNRQALLVAQAALAANPQLPRAQRQDPRQLQDAIDRADAGVRLYERRMTQFEIPNVAYDPNIHGQAIANLTGRGMRGGVSADMAGMDEEYLDLRLHDGFVERGNWSGMMKAVQQMPTHPYGAGIEGEEGEEMPIGVSGSSHRVGFYDGGDLLSSDEEPEEEAEDDDMYDREMAGRGQLDDAAERIQANRTKSELNVAKGGAKNMKEMLAKLKMKIKCY
jgi:hypothetical protein